MLNCFHFYDCGSDVGVFITGSGPGDLSPFAVIVRGGINNSIYVYWDSGPSFLLGLEYLINNVISIEAIVGYHLFKGNHSARSLKIWQFSVNGKFYLMNIKLRPFVNGGVGFYIFNPGDNKLGYNVGGGFQYALSSRFSLEAVYSKHIIDTEGGSLKFSIFQGGFRFRF